MVALLSDSVMAQSFSLHRAAEKAMLNLHGNDVVNGENFPLDIWSLYMSQVKDPALDFPRPDAREFVPLSRGYVASAGV